MAASSKIPAANVDLFDLYFQRADFDSDGRISGAEAVAFFQGAGLPKLVLAQVWKFANPRQADYLGRHEFYNALKLVTVAQSNRKLTTDIVKAALYGPAAAKIPAPKINFTAGPQTQIPGGQFQPAQPVVGQDKISALSPVPIPGVGPVTGQNQASWPKMTQNDAQKYMRIFVEVDTDKDGKITGHQARNLFLSWRLPREVLEQVWDLSDQDSDSMLSFREFCVALYLLERHREGRPIPAALPSNVIFDISGFVQPATNAGGFQRQQVISGPGGQQTTITMGSQRPLPRPVAVPQGDEDLKGSQPKSRVPELEKHLIDLLSTEEPNSLNLKFEDAMKAQKKFLYRSSCDHHLNEIMGRSSADRNEVESLAKKYEEKYKKTGDVASKLTIEEISSVSPTNNLSVSVALPAPPITVELLAEGSIRYPSIDLGLAIATPLIDNTPSTSNSVDGGLCAICWEAPTQGACVPCGHMAGCITCLTMIKDKGSGCPVCRSKIDLVVRLYTV